MTRFAPRTVFCALAAGLSAWLVAGCGLKVASGGDATETGNARVSGQVVMEDGLPIVGTEVTILPSDFNPAAGIAVPDSQRDTTDADGHYRFDGLKDGSYTLQMRHAGMRTRSVLFGIRLEGEPVSVKQDTLHAPGSMSVPLPETGDIGGGWVYVPGTTIRKRVDSELRIAGAVLLDSLPAGLMPSVEYTKGETDSRPVPLASDVAIHPREVTYVNAYATWSGSAKFVLNTTAAGVAIAKAQRDFPLLVRLSAPGFDFSQAAPGGADLRFAKADGTPLPREIASWDAQAGKADVWVRMDTVRAGSASQYITMHWGKADAAAPGPRRPVFDTLAGFSGVWHLEEDAEGVSANRLYKDATGAGSDGDDRIANASRDGVVGAGKGLDSGDYITTSKAWHGLESASSFSLSVWYRSAGKGMGVTGGELLSVGDNYGLRLQKDSVLHLWVWPAKRPAGATADWYELRVKRQAFVDGGWHHVTGTFDGAALRLYVDGDEAGSVAAPEPAGLQFPANATLGRHGMGKPSYEYAGDLDEAQVHTLVRDPDWIKMSFENQKAGSKFPSPAEPQ